MDEETNTFLKSASLKNIIVIDSCTFQTEDLKKVKEERGRAEYCWTCTPFLIKYCLDTYSLKDCTYLDADIFFFNDPEILFAELDEKYSVAITRHNYSPEHDQTEVSGIYCVQFVWFQDSSNGREALDWWCSACLESCELKPEEGKCGDQKYLDDWTERFQGVHVFENPGGGVAPWNIQHFNFRNDGTLFIVQDGKEWPVIFFHYHGLRFVGGTHVRFSGSRYQIDKFSKETFYTPYIKELLELRGVHQAGARFEFNEDELGNSLDFSGKLKGFLKKYFSKNYNISYSLSEFLISPVCPVCSSNETQIKYDHIFDDRYGYPVAHILWECSDCKHFFLQNEFNDFDLNDLYSNFYPRSETKLEDFSPLVSEEGVIGWLNGEKSGAWSWVPEKVKILDIGCGLGQSLAYHQARGCDAYGVEADNNIERFGKKYGLKVKVGLFSPDLFPDRGFDYVTMDQVIEHSKEPHKLIKDVAKVLNPNGNVVLSTPNPDGWGSHFFGRKWINWHSPYHLNLFSKKSLLKLLESSNFEVVELKTITHSNWLLYQWLHFLSFPKREERSIFWCGRKKSSLQLMGWFFFRGCHALGFNHLITRFFDMIGYGDNLVVVLRKKNA
jgi:2-polyprenyl-3-methyl-5-hydroxy-6-metoxy-1,4-benzoquinol methylase